MKYGHTGSPPIPAIQHGTCAAQHSDVGGCCGYSTVLYPVIAVTVAVTPNAVRYETGNMLYRYGYTYGKTASECTLQSK
jgi:hypothetical protein